MTKMLVLYALVWIVFHFGSGVLAHYMPARILAALPLIARTWGWEHGGKAYRRLGVHRWKDRLPEAGAVLPGGFSKRRLSDRSPAYFERFVVETSRAELTHWLPWMLSLTFFVWTPWPIAALMVLYGAATNLPCILVQRYNRARLLSLSARRSD
jgi:glycosyl-4,4'-diaponeurosporenoate acyltransferase